MKVYYRYVLKKYFVSFFLSLLMIILLIISIDLSDKLGRFVDFKVPVKEIVFNYYLALVPFYLNLFTPLFLFISVIFFTSKLASNSEIIALLSNGVSFFKLSIPYLLGTVVIALLSFYLGNYVIPPSNKKRIEFEKQYITRGIEYDQRHIHRQDKENTFIFIKFLDRKNVIGYNFTLERFEKNRLVEKLTADNIVWDENKGKWVVNNYRIVKIGQKVDIEETGISKELNLNIKPKDLLETVVDISTLNFNQLNNFIKLQKKVGNKNLNAFLLEKHKRIAMPFSGFILVYIGLIMSSKKKRGGTGLNLGIGITVSLLFILLQKITDQWAISGIMPVWLAVWFINLLFIPVVFVLFKYFAPR